MSKERLEEIEAKYSTLTVSSEKNSTEYTEVDVEDLVFLIQNSFKQAERVQELEKEIEDWRKEVKKWQRFFREESQKNKRYCEALEEISKMRIAYADMAGAKRTAQQALEGEE